MRRRLFTIVSALSIVLCVATVAAWVRSYHFSDDVIINDGDGRTGELIESTCKRVLFAVVRARQAADGTAGGFRVVYKSDSPYDMFPLPHQFAGIGWGQTPTVPPWFARPAIAMQYGYIVALLLLFPAMWLHQRLKVRWVLKQGHCPSCGYDLRATPDRCPECGTSFPVEART